MVCIASGDRLQNCNNGGTRTVVRQSMKQGFIVKKERKKKEVISMCVSAQMDVCRGQSGLNQIIDLCESMLYVVEQA